MVSHASSPAMAIDVVEPEFCLLEYMAYEWQRAADMVARGKFRHDAAIFGVHVDLGMQGVCEQAVLGVVKRDAGFVAGRFDAEDYHGCRLKD